LTPGAGGGGKFEKVLILKQFLSVLARYKKGMEFGVLQEAIL